MAIINACKTCGLVQRMDELQPGTVAECCRCGSVVRKRQVNSRNRTAADDSCPAKCYTRGLFTCASRRD
jgi:uncharacterized paraquat-inducible protein A